MKLDALFTPKQLDAFLEIQNIRHDAKRLGEHLAVANERIEKLEADSKVMAQHLFDKLTASGQTRVLDGKYDKVTYKAYIIAREILKERPDESL